MRYLSLHEFKQEKSEFTFPISSEQLAIFRKEVYDFSAWQNETITDKETFILACTSEKQILFITWTEQQKNLEKVLKTGKIERVFSDDLKLKQHNWSLDYFAFLTPYLYPILRSGFKQDGSNAIEVLSFSVLLRTKEQDSIQDLIVDWHRELKTQISKKIEAAFSDQEIVNVLNEELTPEFWKSLNYFNEHHYSVKTLWLEYLLGLVYHPKSTKRLMIYIVEVLKRVELTASHKKQLAKEEDNLKKGIHVLEKSHFPWKRVIGAVVLGVAIIAGLIGLFFIEPNPVVQQEQENTSFMSFSPKERQKMDSLLGEAKKMEAAQDDNVIDSDLPFIGEQLVRKRGWKNNLFQRMYTNWSNADSLVSTSVFSPSKKETRIFPGTTKLKGRKTGIPAEIQNETSLTLLCIVFDDRKDQPVYSMYVSAGSYEKFGLKEAEILFVLPGSNVPQNLSNDKLPFKEINSSFFDELSGGYTVNDYAPAQIKLIWKSLGGSSLYLVDLNSALTQL